MKLADLYPPIFFEKIFGANNNACIFAFHFGNGVRNSIQSGRSVKRLKIKNAGAVCEKDKYLYICATFIKT